MSKVEKQELFYKIVHINGGLSAITKLIESLQKQREKLEADLNGLKAECKEGEDV